MNIAVLKISGKALENIFEKAEWIESIKIIKDSYDGLVIVHGAGTSITEWSEALGISSEFINGQRVSSEKMVEVVAAVQSGMLNAKIVSRLVSSGFKALGLTGIDKGTFTADYLDKNLGYVGIPKVTGSVEWIKELMNSGTIPVFSSLCMDSIGNLMNVNADVFTETIAAALKADSVFFVSDVQGVKLNGSIQNKIDETDIVEGIKHGQITDGMIPKLNSCVSLLNKGVDKIWIGSKNLEKVFDDNYKYNGTWIVQSA
jgi:acetylglutamate kinase